MANDLERLLVTLEQCEPRERIDLREPVLAHGSAALGALETLVSGRPDLAGSIAAWLEVLARRDPATRPAVFTALRRMARSIPEPDGRYARDALVRLGGTTPTAPRAPARGAAAVQRGAGTE